MRQNQSGIGSHMVLMASRGPIWTSSQTWTLIPNPLGSQMDLKMGTSRISQLGWAYRISTRNGTLGLTSKRLKIDFKQIPNRAFWHPTMALWRLWVAKWAPTANFGAQSSQMDLQKSPKWGPKSSIFWYQFRSPHFEPLKLKKRTQTGPPKWDFLEWSEAANSLYILSNSHTSSLQIGIKIPLLFWTLFVKTFWRTLGSVRGPFGALFSVSKRVSFREGRDHYV